MWMVRCSLLYDGPILIDVTVGLRFWSRMIKLMFAWCTTDSFSISGKDGSATDTGEFMRRYPCLSIELLMLISSMIGVKFLIGAVLSLEYLSLV